jgi:hypothetical protein
MIGTERGLRFSVHSKRRFRQLGSERVLSALPPHLVRQFDDHP